MASCPKPWSGLIPCSTCAPHHRFQLRTSHPEARNSTQVVSSLGSLNLLCHGHYSRSPKNLSPRPMDEVTQRRAPAACLSILYPLAPWTLCQSWGRLCCTALGRAGSLGASGADTEVCLAFLLSEGNNKIRRNR